ncbi:hypothetical protein [Shewanella phage FishSpeaker]|nr:hypothetical protein [Shewanella phage FishSpeaker]
MSHKRQKPKKRKVSKGRPQKLHKINGRIVKRDIAGHINMLKAQNKLSEAINAGELNDDTIPDLIQETISGVYRMTTSLLCINALLKERTIKLIPNFASISEKWDRQVVRFEENAEVYMILKEQQLTDIENDKNLSEEEKAEMSKDESNLSDIVFDLVDGINELFINLATEIADLTMRYSNEINEYIKDHVLENETPNDFAVRICQAHIEEIRAKYATKLNQPIEEVAKELIGELASGEPANV